MELSSSLPPGGSGLGNLMVMVQATGREVAVILIVGVGVIALLAIAWALPTVFDAARRSKPTMNWKRGMALGLFASQRAPTRGMTPWVMVGLAAIVGAAVVVFVIYLMREAINVL